MDLQQNELVDNKFRILKLLGTGGMGVAYVAEHVQLGRTVALKLMTMLTEPEPGQRERIFREAKALSRLSHKNIVAFHSYGVWHGHPYVDMEVVDGQWVEAMLASRRPLSPQFTVEVMKQLCSALSHAHARGIIHRDLKPGNIIIDTTSGAGELAHSSVLVKIIDFGLVQLLPDSGMLSQKLTQTGMTLGTLLYMAPEQCTSAKVDGRADLYAAGAIMFQCLSGQPPFEAHTPLAVMYQHRQEQIPRLPRSDDGSRELQNIIDKAMAKNLEDRYQSPVQMLVDLERINPASLTSTPSEECEDASSSAVGSAQATASGSQVASADKRRVPIGRALLMLCLAAVALASYACWKSSSNKTQPKLTSDELYRKFVLTAKRMTTRQEARECEAMLKAALAQDKIDGLLDAERRLDIHLNRILTADSIADQPEATDAARSAMDLIERSKLPLTGSDVLALSSWADTSDVCGQRRIVADEITQFLRHYSQSANTAQIPFPVHTQQCQAARISLLWLNIAALRLHSDSADAALRILEALPDRVSDDESKTYDYRRYLLLSQCYLFIDALPLSAENANRALKAMGKDNRLALRASITRAEAMFASNVWDEPDEKLLIDQIEHSGRSSALLCGPLTVIAAHEDRWSDAEKSYRLCLKNPLGFFYESRNVDLRIYANLLRKAGKNREANDVERSIVEMSSAAART